MKEDEGRVKLEELFNLQTVIIYLLAINLLTFFMMWLDKRKARYGRWRIPENTLLLFVVLGGGIGGIAGMYIFHHKTHKAKFVVGFPVILICEILLGISIFS
ncbi:MAG: DUF1294 domain-containing protein [Clostridia bacterium]|nr:DUF1294 domain-containing protein [Clostridia bacterium]